jgi:DNA-binding transcriptional regulator YiaG
MNDIDAMIAAAHAEAEALARGESHSAGCTCGTGRTEERLVIETIPYGDGDDTFQVEVPVIYCLDCELGFTDQRAERLRHAAFCRHQGLLAPADVKALRDSLAMSRREFDEAFGIPPASMERWENGRLIQNRSLDTLLRALSNPATATRVDRRVVKKTPNEIHGNVIHGRFGALASRPAADQADAIRRRDQFRLRAYG